MVDITRIPMMVALAIAIGCVLKRRQLTQRPALFAFLAASLVTDLRALFVTDSRSQDYIDLYCQSAIGEAPFRIVRAYHPVHTVTGIVT